MQKVDLIILVSLLFWGCSAVKRSSGTEIKKPLNESSIIEQVISQNVTNKGFFISKSEISIISDGGRLSVIGTIKFEIPDKYLVSLKSKTGIEAARIYIDSDTILVNDRINKTLYYGSAKYMEKKYGMSTRFLPFVFGDFVINESSDLTILDCVDQQSNTVFDLDGRSVNYTIDCKKKKLVSVRSGKLINNSQLIIHYSDFKKYDECLVPASISLEGILPDTKIEIVIKNIDLRWGGTVEFIPGNKYDKVELL